MKPTRDDLRIHTPCSFDPSSDDHKHTRKVTDADLAAMGLVKLDVDVEHTRADFELGDWLGMPDARDVIRQVLAALDGETA